MMACFYAKIDDSMFLRIRSRCNFSIASAHSESFTDCNRLIYNSSKPIVFLDLLESIIYSENEMSDIEHMNMLQNRHISNNK